MSKVDKLHLLQGSGRTAVLGALLATVTTLLVPAQLFANSKQLMVVRDDRQLWQSGDTARENALNDMLAQGVDVIQIFINWNKVAPEPDSQTKPSFNESDSTTYGSTAFTGIDGAVRSATEMGFKVMINPIGPAPDWASTNKSNERFRGQYPSLTRWSRFVRAVATRYNGRFDPGDGGGTIPRVSWWGAWNEPNFGAWLQPQWKYSSTLGKKIPRSPHLYRSMYKRAVTQIRKAKIKGAKFFIGDLGPVGKDEKTTKSNIGPKRWLYEFFCLTTKGRALKGKERRARGCPKSFGKIRANGIAHHPHMTVESQSPFASNRSAQDLTLQNADEMVTVLDRAARRSRIKKKAPIYFMEFGIRTSESQSGQASTAFQHGPPDGEGGPPGGGDGQPGGNPPGGGGRAPGPRGVSYAKQAQYMNESEYISYKYSRVRSHSQYPWVDDPSTGGAKGFQSGLYTSDSVKKPSYDAFRLPIFVSKRGCNKVMVWGKVRPKTGSKKVEIQAGDGTNFATVKTVTVKNSRKRYFKTSVKRSGACNEKWRLAWVDQNGTTYTSRVASASKYR